MACYARIESVKGVPFSFNMGVAFLILFLFVFNSFAVDCPSNFGSLCFGTVSEAESALAVERAKCSALGGDPGELEVSSFSDALYPTCRACVVGECSRCSSLRRAYVDSVVSVCCSQNKAPYIHLATCNGISSVAPVGFPVSVLVPVSISGGNCTNESAVNSSLCHPEFETGAIIPYTSFPSGAFVTLIATNLSKNVSASCVSVSQGSTTCNAPTSANSGTKITVSISKASSIQKTDGEYTVPACYKAVRSFISFSKNVVIPPCSTPNNAGNGCSGTVSTTASTGLIWVDSQQGCKSPIGLGWSEGAFCAVGYNLEYVGGNGCSNNPPLLSCSDPVPVPEPRCRTGFAYWGTDEVRILQALGYWGEGAFNTPSVPWSAGMSVGCTVSQPNGSQCQLSEVSDPTQLGCYDGLGAFRQYYVCSDGSGAVGNGSSSSEQQQSSSSSCNEELPECICSINPNAIVCQGSSSSSGGQPNQSGQSSDSGDICQEFPNLPECECKRNPSLPWCNNSNSSNSNDTPSSSSVPSLCEAFPSLWYCQNESDGGSSAGSSSPSGGNNGSGNLGGVWGGSGNGGSPFTADSSNVGQGNGNDPNGTTCLKNNNCNWARIDVQLEQLGVENDTRKLVSDIASLQRAGYNLTNEQNILLHSAVQAINSGSADVVGAIDRLASAVGNSDSSAFNSALTSWQDMLDRNSSGLDGIGKSVDSLNTGLGATLKGIGDKLDSLVMGIGDFIKEGLSKFAGDTSGTGAFDNALKEYGEGSGSAMGDSLGNGLEAKGKIKKAISIDSADFKFLGSSDKCPVWDFTFNWSVGKFTLACSSSKCKINICDVYGFNFGALFRALVWLGAMVLILYMNLRVLQSGGH